jgi:hypothetical protein
VTKQENRGRQGPPTPHTLWRPRPCQSNAFPLNKPRLQEGLWNVLPKLLAVFPPEAPASPVTRSYGPTPACHILREQVFAVSALFLPFGVSCEDLPYLDGYDRAGRLGGNNLPLPYRTPPTDMGTGLDVRSGSDALHSFVVQTTHQRMPANRRTMRKMGSSIAIIIITKQHSMWYHRR